MSTTLGEQVKKLEESFQKLRAERDEARADADALRQRAEGVEKNFASVVTLNPDACVLLRWRNELDEARARVSELEKALESARKDLETIYHHTTCPDPAEGGCMGYCTSETARSGERRARAILTKVTGGDP